MLPSIRPHDDGERWSLHDLQSELLVTAEKGAASVCMLTDYLTPGYASVLLCCEVCQRAFCFYSEVLSYYCHSGALPKVLQFSFDTKSCLHLCNIFEDVVRDTDV
jgi:hypothetical protein